MALRPHRKTMDFPNYSCPFGGKQFKDEKWIYSHPGGYNNLQSAYEVEEKASDLLFLSCHTGHNIDKCYAVAEKYGYKLPQRTAFHDELQAIFANIIKEYWIHGVIYQIYCFLLTILIFITFYYQLFYPSLLTRFTFGLFVLSHNFSIHHVRHHCGKLYDNKLLETILSPIYTAIQNVHILFPTRRWIDVHQKSHHIYVNSEEDNDIWMTYPFMCESPFFQIKWFHKYQSFYTPLLFAMLYFVGPIRQIVPINPITKEKIGNIKYVYLHFLIFIIIPCVMHRNVFYTLFLHIISSIFYAMFYAYLFQISHNQKDLAHFHYEQAEKRGDEDIINNYDEWIRHSIESAVTYNVNGIYGYCFTTVFGGINAQIEHHIAPSIYPVYYALAARQIQEFSKKHGIRYIMKEGAIEAVVDYHTFLHRFAQKALAKDRIDKNKLLDKDRNL